MPAAYYPTVHFMGMVQVERRLSFSPTGLAVQSTRLDTGFRPHSCVPSPSVCDLGHLGGVAKIAPKG